jgi:chromosome segregation ATPase
MKTKMSITLTIVALVITGLFVSCQQGSNIEDRVESKVSDLRDNLNDIAEDDDNFIVELREELEDFESSMNEIREDINESGEQISMSARQAIDDLQGEARSLRMKLESRSGYADTDRNITDDNRPLREDRDVVEGDRTAQMQRDTTERGVTRNDDGLFSDDDDGPNVMQIDQELRAEFNNFRQNVNQWVDRLSADTRDN